MPRDETAQRTATDTEHLRALFDQQRNAVLDHPYPELKQRLERLSRMGKMLDLYQERFAQAIQQDFGNRCPEETMLSDVLPIMMALSQARKNLRKWMKQRRVHTDMLFKPGWGRTMPQPLGVVGVIAPWNFPLQLTLSPVVTALAAGNRVIAKPSELTPKLAETLRDAVDTHFAPEEFAVVTGAVEVSQLMTSLPFDHIVFTGSTSVGRLVAQAAAKNLTPVTLELGGKSPAIIDQSADLNLTLRRIVKGKLVNSGQICVAPDYLIVPTDKVADVATRAIQIAREMYPTLLGNPDVTAIINKGHYDRLHALISDAVAKGATVTDASNGAQKLSEKVIPLTVLTDVTDDMTVMQDEIFGPVLPILPAASQSDAIRIVKSRPRPLALYWFGTDKKRRDVILRDVHAGGITINDTLLHVVQDNLPFGGVGDSGMGNYHGQAGFERLSHMKAVFYQAKHTGTDKLSAPYDKPTKKMAALTMWWANR